MKNPVKEAHIEALKEVARWIVTFIFWWVVSETLKQVNLIPEHSIIHIWVFTYLVPIRAVFQFTLTIFSMYLDKWIHENPNIPFKGILPW